MISRLLGIFPGRFYDFQQIQLSAESKNAIARVLDEQTAKLENEQLISVPLCKHNVRLKF